MSSLGNPTRYASTGGRAVALSTRQRLRDTVQRGDDDGRTSADRPQHGAHGCAVGVHARVVATCRAIRASCLGIATGLGLQSSGHRFEPSGASTNEPPSPRSWSR